MTGRPADPGLDADLATLRQGLKARQRGTGSTKNTLPALAALDRVEAELSRLREQRDEYAALRRELATLLGPVKDHHGLSHAALWIEKVSGALGAAEARCARLQQALDGIESTLGTMSLNGLTGDQQKAIAESWGMAREKRPDPQLVYATDGEALAGPDTPADEPCPFCGFAGPFDGHVCEPVLCGCGDPENCRYATAEEHAGPDTLAESPILSDDNPASVVEVPSNYVPADSQPEEPTT